MIHQAFFNFNHEALIESFSISYGLIHNQKKSEDALEVVQW